MARLVDRRGDVGGIDARLDQVRGDSKGLRGRVGVAERARVGDDRRVEVHRDVGGQREPGRLEQVVDHLPGGRRPRVHPVDVAVAPVVSVMVDVEHAGARSARSLEKPAEPGRIRAVQRDHEVEPVPAGLPLLEVRRPRQEVERDPARGARTRRWPPDPSPAARGRVRAAIRARPRPDRRARTGGRADPGGPPPRPRGAPPPRSSGFGSRRWTRAGPARPAAPREPGAPRGPSGCGRRGPSSDPGGR